MIIHRIVLARDNVVSLHAFLQLYFNSFPNGQILDSSKLKEFADDDFKFDENGREFSK